MRGVFDEGDVEQARDVRDDVLTVGVGKLSAFVLLLIALCGLCFGLGYAVGHRGVKSATTAVSTIPASTTPADQQPLQANGSIPKPSAIAPNASALAEGSAATRQDSAPDSSTTGQEAIKASGQGAAMQGQQAQVGSAVASPVANAQVPQPPAMSQHSAATPAASIMVQIAAVANPEDANVLMNALRKRNYTVTARHEATDNLIHVRLGPFTTRAEAEQWRTKLTDDGYNAVVQQ